MTSRCVLAWVTIVSGLAIAGETGDPMYSAEDQHRILGLMPNYKTTSLKPGELRNLSIREKFALATKDAFDSSAFISTLFYAGIGHATRQYPTMGGGVEGFSHRAGVMFLDSLQGTYMTEAIVPAIFHQDPRFFRQGSGSGISRASHALTALFVVRSDHGSNQLNTSEIVGNFASSSLSNLYYPGTERSFENTGMRVGLALISDGMNNLVREFWPDIVHHFKHTGKKSVD